MADKKRIHTGNYGQIVEINQMFPSSEINRADPNNITPKQPSDHAECVVPILHFPLHDGIVFEWDMVDNFKAGDFIDALAGGIDNDAYVTLQPLRYVDIMGRADLFTFKLFNKQSFTQKEVKALPKAISVPDDADCQMHLPATFSIALDKDCREEISFNYQINLLHQATDSDSDFLTFPNLFGQKESSLKICLLSEPQNLFNENINLTSALVLADNVQYDLIDDGLNAIEIRIKKPNEDMSKAKSIVFYQEDDIGGRYAYIVKNIQTWADEIKSQSWWIYPVYNT